MSKGKYSSVVPANAYTTNHSSFAPKFNVEHLEQTDVIDVIRNKYNNNPFFLPLIQVGLSPLILINEVVRVVEGNIVALADGKGRPFATGLLIHSQFVLTARHSLEERDLISIVACVDYQKDESEKLNYGSRIFNLGVVEENEELDYAIIRLNEKVLSNEKINLASGANYSGNSILFHHPGGEPKKVSVHACLESINKTLQYNAFHDSAKGSSGGVYVNTLGQVFALHCLNQDGIIGAQPIEKIYEKSAILQALYNNQGQAIKPLTFLRVREGINYLSKSSYSQEYQKYLEVLDGKPEGLLGVNDGRHAGQENLTYHHIIPKANLEFLWMLGKEYFKIECLLKSLAWKEGSTKKEELIVNNVIWAPWNLFIGPSARARGNSRGYDSYDGSKLEASKPLSFNKELWYRINKLNQCIENCWNTRGEISKLSKTNIVTKLDMLGNGASSLFYKDNGCVVRKIQVKMFTNYNSSLEELVAALEELKQINPKTVHKTCNDDWSVRKSQNGRNEYLLRRSYNDGIPATGLMSDYISITQVQSSNNRNFANELTRSREREIGAGMKLPEIGRR